MAMENAKVAILRSGQIQTDLNSALEDVNNAYKNSEFNFPEVSEKGFTVSNIINDLTNDPKIAIKEESIFPNLGTVKGYETYEAIPFKEEYQKIGISYVNPNNPDTLRTKPISEGSIDRWVTRTIFKFKPEHYGYDRAVFEIPVESFLENEGLMDNTAHKNTFKAYPYIEEIIMTSPKNEKYFIHFINVQYDLAEQGRVFNRDYYNLMVVKDRVKYGAIDDSGKNFKTYASVYVNSVERSLARLSIDLTKLILPMPDGAYGEELLDTMWDCRVIWRHDAPSLTADISYDIEINNGIMTEAFSDGATNIFETANENVLSIDSISDKPVVRHDFNAAIAKQRNTINTFYPNDASSSVVSKNNYLPHVVDNKFILHGDTIYMSPNYNGTAQYRLTNTLSELEWNVNNYTIPHQFIQLTSDINLGIGFKPIELPVNGGEVINSENIHWNYFDNIYKVAEDYRMGVNDSSDTYPLAGTIVLDSGIEDDHVVKVLVLTKNIVMGTCTLIVYKRYSKWKVEVSIDNDEPVATMLSSTEDNNYINDVKDVSRVSYTEALVWDGSAWYRDVLDGGTLPIEETSELSLLGYEGLTSCNFEYDLTDWKSGNIDQTFALNGNWLSVAYGNNMFVAVGDYTQESTNSYSSNFAYSNDGINWNIVNIPSSSVRPHRYICYGNNMFVAVSDRDALYSTDGLNWTVAAYSKSIPTPMGICYGNGTFVIISEHASTFMCSYNGIEWFSSNEISVSKQWWAIAYGSGVFVVTTPNDNTSLYSTNGIDWTISAIGGSGHKWNYICYGNDKFVVSGYASGSLAYSTDGILWKTVSNVFGSSNIKICFGNGVFYAIYTAFHYSYDGISWVRTTEYRPSGQDYYMSVCYGDGKFVIIGYIPGSYSTTGYTCSSVAYLLYSSIDEICNYRDKYAIADTNSGKRVIKLNEHYSRIDHNAEVAISIEGATISTEGPYHLGSTISITANAAPEGFRFHRWVLNSGLALFSDITSSTTNVILQSVNVTISPSYTEITANVDVENGTITSPAPYIYNSVIELTANEAPTGQEFDKWVLNSGTGEFTSETSSTTQFTIKSENISISATYKYMEATVNITNGTIITEAPHYYNDTIEIVAGTAPTGYEFDRWTITSGSGTFTSPTAETTTFLITSTDVSITANWKASVANVTITNGSITTAAPYYYDGTIEIVAGAAPTNMEFSHWEFTTGTGTFDNVNASTTTVTLTALNVGINAVYKYMEATITITDGTITTAAPYYVGSTVEIVANEAPTNMEFSNWQITGGDGTISNTESSTTTLTVTGTAVSVEAVYKYLPATVEITDGTITTVAPYYVNSTVTIVANAAPTNMEFSHWSILSGDASATLTDVYASTTTLFLTATNVSVKANYKYKQATITVTSGTISTAAPYYVNTPVQIVANAAPTNMEFSHWSITSGTADITNVNNSTTTLMPTSTDIAVTANYKYKQATINITSGTISTSAPYYVNSAVQIVANAAPTNMEFSHWTITSGTANIGNVNNATTTLTPTSTSVAVTANYKYKQASITVNSGTISTAAPYYVNTAVQIVANAAPANMQFSHWSITSGTANIGNVNNATTTLTPTSTNVVVTANYKTFTVSATVSLSSDVSATETDGGYTVEITVTGSNVTPDYMVMPGSN